MVAVDRRAVRGCERRARLGSRGRRVRERVHVIAAVVRERVGEFAADAGLAQADRAS